MNLDKRFQGLKQFFTGKDPRQMDVDGEKPASDEVINDYNFQDLVLGSILDRGEFPKVPENREELRDLYDDMDQGIIASALDMYAEDATQYSIEKEATFWTESENKDIVGLCKDLLKYRLDIEDMAFPIARDTAKYGEDFNSLKYSTSAINGWIPTKELVYRVIDMQENLLGFSFESEDSKVYSLPWDFVHFRIVGSNRDRKYGTSMLRSLVEIDEKLRMMEDSATLFRLLKMPDRDIHFVDCTNLSPSEASGRIQRRRSVINKQKYIDAEGQQIKKRWVPMSRAVGDLFVPTYNGRDDRVESRSTSSRIQDVYDLEYFRRLWCASARIPPEAIGFDFSGGIRFESNKSMLQQDVQYARKAKRIQRAMLKGIRYVCMLELCFKGIDPYEEKNNFKVFGEPISFLDEQQRQELYQARIGIIDAFSRLARDLEIGGYKWTNFLLVTFGGFTQDLVDEVFLGEKPEDISEEEKTMLKEKYLKDSKIRKLISKMSNQIKEAFRHISSVSSKDFKFRFNIGNINTWKIEVGKLKKELILYEEGTEEYNFVSEKLDRLYKGNFFEVFDIEA